MRFLLAEDDPEKARRIEEFLLKECSRPQVVLAKSFGAALAALISTPLNVDVLLLDMSMPAFEASVDEPDGGAPESFAGRDLLAQMKLRAISVPTIVITMFDFFGHGRGKASLADLTKELERDYGGSFIGLVQYSQAKEGWEPSLLKLIRKIKR